MTRPPRRLLRRLSLACLIAASILTVPVAAWFIRPTIYFAASFDLPGAPGSGLAAEVGQFSTGAPSGVFSVVPSNGKGGELEVVDQGTGSDLVLEGLLKKQYTGQEIRLEYEIRPSQSTTALSVRLVDDSDTGMIDASFDGDGRILIDGVDVGAYEAGSTYTITVDVFDPLAGAASWAVLIERDDGAAWMDGGPLSLPSQLSVRRVEIVRPAGSTAGEFHVDDLRVLSYSLPFGL